MTKIEEALELLLGMQNESSQIVSQHIGRLVPEARAEVEAIKQAAKDLNRMAVGDFTYSIRDRAAGDPNFTGNTWEHPDVRAWSDASEVIRKIAKGAP